MPHNIYSPEYGPFPPHIETSQLTLQPTDISEGNDIFYLDGYLYVIDSSNNGTFHIYHTQNDDMPELVSSISGLGNLRQIEVKKYDQFLLAAITARECGVYILNVTAPQNPFICCHYDSIEFATGVTLYNNYIIIGNRSYGVEIADITDPSNPMHVSSIRAGEVQSVFVSEGILYTGSWAERQVNIFDIHIINDPKYLSTVPLAGRGDGVYVKDGILYAAFGQHKPPASGKDIQEYGYGRGNGFCIYNVKNPSRPELLSSVTLPIRYYTIYWDFWDITLCNTFVILSHTMNGVWIYDVSDLSNPILTDHVGITTNRPITDILTLNEYTTKIRPFCLPYDFNKVVYSPVTGVASADGKLYICSKFQNLYIAYGKYFTSNSDNDATICINSTPYYEKNSGDNTDNACIISTGSQVHRCIYHNSIVWAACGKEGIKAFDFASLKCIAHHKTNHFAMDLSLHGNIMCIAAGRKGIIFYEISDNTLIEINQFPFYNRFTSQAVISENGKFVIAHVDDKHIFIVDISDILHPKIVLEDSHPVGLIYRRQITPCGIEGKLYGGYWNSTLTRWYDLSGDRIQILPFQHNATFFRNGITGYNIPYHVLIIQSGGYHICDIRENLDYNSLTPTKIPGIEYLFGKPIIDDNYLYVTDRLNGDVIICDIREKDCPVLIKKYNFSGHPDLACPTPTGVAIPLGHQGIAFIHHKDHSSPTNFTTVIS